MLRRPQSALHLNYVARQNVLETLRRCGPSTIDSVSYHSGYGRSYSAFLLQQLYESSEVLIVEASTNGEVGRPINVYGLPGIHVKRPTIRDRILTLLRDDGPSPSLELARKIGIHPKTCRYHMLRLLSQRKVRAVGKLQRPSGGTPATVWSAHV